MERTLPTPEQVFRHVPCLCAALLIAARTVTRLYNQHLRAVGLEATQHSMMRVLEAVGPMTQVQLGGRLAAEKTTMSRGVALLVKRGWVEVAPGEDKRERVVVLTTAGRKKLKEAMPHWERAQEAMRKRLTAAGFEQVRNVMPDVALAAMD